MTHIFEVFISMLSPITLSFFFLCKTIFCFMDPDNMIILNIFQKLKKNSGVQ